MSEIMAMALGLSTLVVGLEDDEESGCLRVYLGHRAKGVYALVEDEEAKDEYRRAWACGGHVITGIPPQEYLYSEKDRP